MMFDDEYFENKKEYFTMGVFEFENGSVLENVSVEYMACGTPEYLENGEIANAIIYCHGSLGNFSSMKKIFPLTNEGDAFDFNNFFFICISALGSPGSCSPSTTGLNARFPKYSIKDVANFQKQFLKEKFGITHVLGIIGNSMGGFVGLTQAIEQPDYMDFLICGVSSYKVAGHDYVLSRFVNEIIESDPDYLSGEITYSLNRTLRLASLAEFNFGLSKEALREKSNEELACELEDFGNESLEMDIYDVKYCNESCMNFNVEDRLDEITSEVLIVSCKQDPHFPPELDGIPMSEMIENSELVIMDSDLGHLCFNELENISCELNDFMEKFR